MGGEFLPKLKMSNLVGSNPFLCCGHPRTKDKTPLDESIFPAMLLFMPFQLVAIFSLAKVGFPQGIANGTIFLAASMYMVTTFEEQREGLLGIESCCWL